MSVALTIQPLIPALSLNPCVYVVSTSETGNDWYIRCYLWIEDTPESDTWTNVADLIQPVIDGTAEINLQPYLNEVLEYNIPDPGADQVQVMTKVSRRYKVEFFEFKYSDLELIEEVYHEDGAVGYKDITALENSQAYLIVLDKPYDDLKIQDGSTELDCDAPSGYLVSSGSTNYTKIGKLYHHAVTTTTANFDEIHVPSDTKVQIYKVTFRTHGQDTREPFALKAGISKELLHKPLATPDDPSNLVATAQSASAIQLTWDDNSDNETGFVLQRSTDEVTWANLVTLGAGVTTHTDSTLSEGQTRYYRVKAITGTKSSGYSNVANATTFIPFIFTVNTANSGVSTSTQFKLPLISSGTYDFTINWGDGNSDTITSYNQSEITHTYSTSGTYSPEIEGQLLGWAFNNTDDCLKITQISKWGNWQSNGAVNVLGQSACFRGCTNLDVTATDAPDLSQCVSLWAFFSGCTSLSSNTNYNNWDVSTILEFRTCFINSNFNNDLDNWDVSNGTTFHQMFSGNSTYNSSTAGWDINGTIEAMFLNCSAFTGIGLNTWNVDGATGNLNDIFEGTNMNADISGWDPSGITGGWRHFVKDNTDFDQDISSWSNIECSGQGAFEGATAFDSELPSWTVKNNCSSMFSGATSFTGLGLSTWTIGTVNSFANFLDNTAVTSSTMDAILNAWAALGTIPSGITFGATNCTRTSASDTAISTLETTHSWTFVGLTKV